MIEFSVPNAAPGTPAKGGYCLGWGIITMPYAREPFITHIGSNTMNLAMIMLQPTRDFGMVLATNVGGIDADMGLRAEAEEVYGRVG